MFWSRSAFVKWTYWTWVNFSSFLEHSFASFLFWDFSVFSTLSMQSYSKFTSGKAAMFLYSPGDAFSPFIFTQIQVSWCHPLYFLTLYHNLALAIILTPISCHLTLFSSLIRSILCYFWCFFCANVFQIQYSSFQNSVSFQKQFKSVCLWPMVRLGASYLPAVLGFSKTCLLTLAFNNHSKKEW